MKPVKIGNVSISSIKQAIEPGFAAVHEDCVQPIVDAGQALLVDDLRPVR